MLCILLGVRKNLSNDHRIRMKVGHYSNNSLRYIDVDKIHDYLGVSVCNALPGFHIFTGSDYTAAFNRKGKIKPLKLLQDNVVAQNAFSSLGSNEAIDCVTLDDIESFVCLWYGQQKA